MPSLETIPTNDPRESLAPHHDRLGLVACAVAGLFVLTVTWCKIDSLDTGYHLAYGGRVLDGLGIVDRDPFLYPEHAIDFINANWGSQVVMARFHRALGANGLIALRTALVIAAFAAVAIATRSFTQRPTWLALVWLLAGVGAYERLGLRPELFSHALLCILLAHLCRGLRCWRCVALCGLIQLAWVNLHSYFLLGIILTGCWLLGAAWNAIRIRHDDADLRRRLRLLGIALAVQIVVCFMNPWTIDGALFPIRTLAYLSGEKIMGGHPADAGENAWSLISEFHSPFAYFGQQIAGRTIVAYFVLLVIVGLGVIAALARGHVGAAIFMLLLAMMSLKMRRNIAPFALAAMPLAIGVIAELTTSWSRAKSLTSWTQRLTKLGVTTLSLWWMLTIINGQFFYSERRITRQFGSGLSDRTFCRDAVRWLGSQSALKPRLFVDYFSSSNTLLDLPDRFQLFVDTNTFAYDESVLRTAFNVGLGRVEPPDVLDAASVNVVLLHAGPDTQPLIKKLVADHTTWALVYFDPQAVVFIRRIPEHVPAILAHQPTSNDFDVSRWIDAHQNVPAYTRALSIGTAIGIPLALGWYEQAEALAAEAVRLAPDYHEAWTWRGICEVNLGRADAKDGRRDEAVRRFRLAAQQAQTARRLAPDYAPAAALARDMQRVLDAAPR